VAGLPLTEAWYSGKCHIEDDLEFFVSASVNDDGCIDVQPSEIEEFDESECDDEEGRKEGDCSHPEVSPVCWPAFNKNYARRAPDFVLTLTSSLV
jgi:hypothetical protein